MMRSRWPVVVLLLGAVAAMVVWAPGTDEVERSSVSRPPEPSAVGDAGASWYSAARDAGVEGLTHLVLITAVGQDADIRADAFGEEGPGGSTELTVAAGTTTVLDVGAQLGGDGQSVMLESTAPIAAEHRLSSADGADQAPCSTFSSDAWYFPAVVTTLDAKARLSLFNPFPGDAAVDIEVAFETGVRVPAALSGLVVPAGTTRVVELGDEVVRRDQFAATVRARSGAVVAELAQSFDGSYADVPNSGVRLVPGSREAAARWSFAGGFVDASATERLVLFNPEDAEVDVLVQVVPYGGMETLPEPFEVTVPPLRYSLLELNQESRVPQVGYHAITVETRGDKPLVAARSMNVSASVDGGETAPLRSLIEGGTIATVGAVAAAQEWVSTGMQVGDEVNGGVFVHNPGDGIAVVEVTALDGTTGESGTPVAVEIPGGDSVVVTAEQLGAGTAPFSTRVAAESPVVVQRLATFQSATDYALGAAVPVVEAVDDLELLE